MTYATRDLRKFPKQAASCGSRANHRRAVKTRAKDPVSIARLIAAAQMGQTQIGGRGGLAGVVPERGGGGSFSIPGGAVAGGTDGLESLAAGLRVAVKFRGT